MDEEILTRIEHLLALNLIQGLEENEAIALLYKVGYNSQKIGDFIGMSDITVRGRFSQLRKEGRIE